MSFSQRDQTILSDLGKAQAIHQDLKELLDFYENLFRAQFAFKSQLGASGKAGDLAKEEVNLTGLTNGLPQITFKELNMQATPFLDLYKSIVKLLIPYAGDNYGLETEPPPGKTIEWAREIFVSRGPLVIAGAAGDWARTASEYVLAPYLQLACVLILPRIPLKEGLLNRLEMAFRSYDPCLACATHALPGALTLVINIRDKDRKIVQSLQRH